MSRLQLQTLDGEPSVARSIQNYALDHAYGKDIIPFAGRR